MRGFGRGRPFRRYRWRPISRETRLRGGMDRYAGRSRVPSGRSGKSMSRSTASGTRTSKRRLPARGSTEACTATSFGMSCADARQESARNMRSAFIGPCKLCMLASVTKDVRTGIAIDGRRGAGRGDNCPAKARHVEAAGVQAPRFEVDPLGRSRCRITGCWGT